MAAHMSVPSRGTCGKKKVAIITAMRLSGVAFSHWVNTSLKCGQLSASTIRLLRWRPMPSSLIAELFTPYWFQDIVVQWLHAESRHDLSSPSIPTLALFGQKFTCTSSAWTASGRSTAAGYFRWAFASGPLALRSPAGDIGRLPGVFRECK